MKLSIEHQVKRLNESILQDSEEEPLSQVISMPCDSSVQHEASNAENIQSQIPEVKEVGILSKSSIADKAATKVPTRARASNPSKPMSNHTLVHDQTMESSRMQGTEDKENETNKVVQRSLVSILNGNNVSDSDEEVEHAIKNMKRSAVKRLPFGNSQVKCNALVVNTQSKGNIRKQHYDPITYQKLRKEDTERHDRPRANHTWHASAVYGDMRGPWHVVQ